MLLMLKKQHPGMNAVLGFASSGCAILVQYSWCMLYAAVMVARNEYKAMYEKSRSVRSESRPRKVEVTCMHSKTTMTTVSILHITMKHLFVPMKASLYGSDIH